MQILLLGQLTIVSALSTPNGGEGYNSSNLNPNTITSIQLQCIQASRPHLTDKTTSKPKPKYCMYQSSLHQPPVPIYEINIQKEWQWPPNIIVQWCYCVETERTRKGSVEERLYYYINRYALLFQFSCFCYCVPSLTYGLCFFKCLHKRGCGFLKFFLLSLTLFKWYYRSQIWHYIWGYFSNMLMLSFRALPPSSPHK